MNNHIFNLELICSDEEADQCPECGHIWPQDRQLHFTDCQYFDENREDSLTWLKLSLRGQDIPFTGA